MSRTIQITETKDFAVTGSSNPLNLTVSNLSNGYNDFDHTSNYAQITMVTGANAISYYYFNFSVNIPADATVNSVTCYARASVPTTSGVSTRTIQLCTGTTGKGTAATLGSSVSSVTGTDLASGTSWTASEINNATLYLYAKRGTSNVNTARYFRFYGATLTVIYTYQQTIYTITCTSTAPNVHVGNATDYTHTYEVAEGHNQNIELVGDMTGAVVTDNDVDITSSVTPMSGGAVISLTNVQADHTILIFIPQTGDKIFVKVNGTWKEAQDVKVKVNGTWQSVSKAYKMVGGSWVEQSDKSSMFDPNALYLKG